MRNRGLNLATLAAGVLLVAAAAGGAAAGPAKVYEPREGAKHVALVDPASEFVPDELIVRFRDGVSTAARAQALSAHGATRVRDLHVPGAVLAHLGPGKGVKAAAEAISRRADVVYAEPNWIYRATATPNDPRYGDLWGLHQVSDKDIDAPEAWDVTTGSASIVVAVADTGVAYDHPDLAPNIWTNTDEIADNGIDDDGNGRVDDTRGWDFIDLDNDPRDFNGHGTHVAGTIGAKGNNATGVVGVNWNVQIMPVRVLGTSGSGTNLGIANGFAYAAANGAQVVNASLGGGGFSQLMKDTIDAATGTLFVVAAGNGGPDGVGDDNDSGMVEAAQYPCNYTSANLICVAATTQTDGLAGFSNFGTTSVDLGAPGTGIWSAWPAYEAIAGAGDGFETATAWTNSHAPAGWTAPDLWARTNETAIFGSWSATDSPGSAYQNAPDLDPTEDEWATNWFTKPGSFDLSGRHGCLASYAMKSDVEDGFDFFTVDASGNGTTWQEVGAWTGTTPNYPTFWFAFEDDISDFDGDSSVFLRFGLERDESIVREGVHVDGVDIKCVGTAYGTSSYKSIQGTSMATPHVAGVAALAWAKNPGVSVAQVRSALLSGGEAIASLSGKTVTGRRLNAAGTLALVPGMVAEPTAFLDFDGDGDSEIAVFRPSNGGWYVQGAALQGLGVSGDVPVPADFDGDGDVERAVFRPSNGGWYVSGSGVVGHGVSTDTPVPADYDGDGDAEMAVYRPSNGGWYVRGQGVLGHGLSTDIPVPADYDGDGDADIAVFRPSNGGWYVRGQGVLGHGVSTDIPVPADYDGDGDAELAVYRPSNGGWYIRGQGVIGHGLSTDIPVPADYDGDGDTDLAVFRPSNGGWYIRGQSVQGWGTSSDKVLALPHAVRKVFFP